MWASPEAVTCIGRRRAFAQSLFRISARLMNARLSSKARDARRNELKKLMREVPEGETLLRILIDLMDDPEKEDPAKDRNAAITGAAFMEHALRKAISTHLITDPIDPQHDYLFESDDAPFKNFSARIKLARALGIINKTDYDQIEIIRNIRNVFAHTINTVTFSTPQIAAYFDDFAIDLGSDPTKYWSALIAPYSSRLAGAVLQNAASRFRFVCVIFKYYRRLSIYVPHLPSIDEAIKSDLSRLASLILK
jgi:hypothetical protein